MIALRDFSSKYGNDLLIVSSVVAGLMLCLLVRKTTKWITTTLEAIEDSD